VNQHARCGAHVEIVVARDAPSSRKEDGKSWWARRRGWASRCVLRDVFEQRRQVCEVGALEAEETRVRVIALDQSAELKSSQRSRASRSSRGALVSRSRLAAQDMLRDTFSGPR
jgi:hypothetical protein